MPAKKKAGRSRRKPYPKAPKKPPRRRQPSSLQKEIRLVSRYLGELSRVLNTVNWVKLEAAGFEGPDGGGVPPWPPHRSDDGDDNGDEK